jgi:hypothetical protein
VNAQQYIDRLHAAPAARRSPATSPSGRLRAAGWTQIAAGDHRADCGMPGPSSGYCVRNARWKEHAHARPMCVQHAVELLTRQGR